MKTQLLHTSRGSFEYSGCNSKVTVAQLKAYLKFNGIDFGNKILKKDLCHTVNRLLLHIQNVNSGKQQGVPIINFLLSQTPQQQKDRLRSQPKKTTIKPKKKIVKRKKVIKKKIVKRKKIIKKKIVKRKKIIKKKIVKRKK